jgi:hypothetical protein
VAKLGLKTPLDRRGSACSCFCTKNQPHRPIIMPFRDIFHFCIDLCFWIFGAAGNRRFWVVSAAPGVGRPLLLRITADQSSKTQLAPEAFFRITADKTSNTRFYKRQKHSFHLSHSFELQRRLPSNYRRPTRHKHSFHLRHPSNYSSTLPSNYSRQNFKNTVFTSGRLRFTV